MWCSQTRNTIRVNGSQATFHQLTTPTDLQAPALQLLADQPALE